MKNIRIYSILMVCSMLSVTFLVAEQFPATSPFAVSNSISQINKLLKNPAIAVVLQESEASEPRFNDKTTYSRDFLTGLLTFLRDASKNGLSKKDHAFIIDTLVFQFGLSYEGCLKLKNVKGGKPVLEEAVDQYDNVITALKEGFTKGLETDFHYIQPAIKNGLIFENLSDIVLLEFTNAYSCNFFAIKDPVKTEATREAFLKAKDAIKEGETLKADASVEAVTAYIDAMTAFADNGGMLNDTEEVFFKSAIAHLRSSTVLQSSASDAQIRSLVASLDKVAPKALSTRGKGGKESVSFEVQELVGLAKTTLTLKKAFNDNKYINQADKDVMKTKESAQEIIDVISEFVRKVAGSLVGGYNLNAVIDGKDATTKADVKPVDPKDKDALKAAQAQLATVQKELDAIKAELAKSTLYEESLKTPAEQAKALVGSVERLAKVLPDTKITKVKSVSTNVCDKAVVELGKKVTPSK